jgi:hypothetical protein
MNFLKDYTKPKIPIFKKPMGPNPPVPVAEDKYSKALALVNERLQKYKDSPKIIKTLNDFTKTIEGFREEEIAGDIDDAEATQILGDLTTRIINEHYIGGRRKTARRLKRRKTHRRRK